MLAAMKFAATIVALVLLASLLVGPVAAQTETPVPSPVPTVVAVTPTPIPPTPTPAPDYAAEQYALTRELGLFNVFAMVAALGLGVFLVVRPR